MEVVDSDAAPYKKGQWWPRSGALLGLIFQSRRISPTQLHAPLWKKCGIGIVTRLLRASTVADGRSDGQSLTRCMSVRCGEAQAGRAMAGAEDAPPSYAYTYVLFYTDARIHAYA